jgi:hypothetical protein
VAFFLLMKIILLILLSFYGHSALANQGVACARDSVRMSLGYKFVSALTSIIFGIDGSKNPPQGPEEIAKLCKESEEMAKNFNNEIALKLRILKQIRTELETKGKIPENFLGWESHPPLNGQQVCSFVKKLNQDQLDKLERCEEAKKQILRYAMNTEMESKDFETLCRTLTPMIIAAKKSEAVCEERRALTTREAPGEEIAPNEDAPKHKKSVNSDSLGPVRGPRPDPANEQRSRGTGVMAN